MTSKPLGIDDISGFEFVKEILHGDPTYAINFDRIQWDNKYNQYVIVEFLLCEEAQSVSPFTSHPNRYFLKNKHKFISLWEMSKQFNARLYLVNYAKKDAFSHSFANLVAIKLALFVYHIYKNYHLTL